ASVSTSMLTVGSHTITAQYSGFTVGNYVFNSSQTTLTQTVNPGPASTATSTVTVSPGSVAAGSAATITLRAKDAFGNNETTGGLAVTFSLGAGTSSGTIGPVTDNGNGTYTATFTATIPGTPRTITATINGSAVTSALPTVTVTDINDPPQAN